MTPARGKLFVRPVETPESLPGGKILLTESTRKDLTAQQAAVVALGDFPYCDDLECEREHWSKEPQPGVYHGRHFFHAKVGSWVLLAPRCLVETDEPNLYVCSQDDVLAVLQV